MLLNKNNSNKYDHLCGLPVVNNYTFLGITLTNKLKINPHTEILKEKNKYF